jgi:hypothetical protein
MNFSSAIKNGDNGMSVIKSPDWPGIYSPQNLGKFIRNWITNCLSRIN